MGTSCKYSGQTEKLDKLQIVSVLTEKLEQIEKAQYKRVGLLDLNCQLQKRSATAKETDKVLSNLTGIPVATEILTGVVTSQEKGHLLNSLYKEYTKYTLLVNNSVEKLQRIGDLPSLSSLLDSVEESLYTQKHFQTQLRSTEPQIISSGRRRIVWKCSETYGEAMFY